MRIARRVVVRGRVQAVGFRAGCATEAERASVTGWVTNRSDGTVEALFEGEPDAVEQLVGWARHGPPGAHVDDVTVSDVEPTDRSAFTVG